MDLVVDVRRTGGGRDTCTVIYTRASVSNKNSTDEADQIGLKYGGAAVGAHLDEEERRTIVIGSADFWKRQAVKCSF